MDAAKFIANIDYPHQKETNGWLIVCVCVCVCLWGYT